MMYLQLVHQLANMQVSNARCLFTRSRGIGSLGKGIRGKVIRGKVIRGKVIRGKSGHADLTGLRKCSHLAEGCVSLDLGVSDRTEHQQQNQCPT